MFDSSYASQRSAGGKRDDDIVIVVMGATGSGKSTLINQLTGDAPAKIGYSLESETADVEAFSFIDTSTRRNVTVVDSPGLDDSRQNMTDIDVLKKIANFLVEEYDANRKINGLIFVQRISDPKFSGQSKRNLEMFRSLCGIKTYKNVIIVTTFWDAVGRELGIKREAEMQTHYFNELTQRGARLMRSDQPRQSAQKILKHVFTLVPAIIQLQQELREEGKTLQDTTAGSVQRQEIQDLISRHQQEVAALQIQIKEIARSNRSQKQILEAEQASLKEKLRRCESESAALRKGLDHERKSREKAEANAALQRRSSSMQRLPSRAGYEFAYSAHYPPHLKSIPQKNRTNILDIFDFSALLETAASLVVRSGCLPAIKDMVPKPTTSMGDLVNHNQELHRKAKGSKAGHNRNMYFKENIGHREDWYTDAVFGQQQLTGTNPTTISLASPRWIENFRAASITQKRTDVARILTEDNTNMYIQDYSDFRSTMRVSPNTEFSSKGRDGTSRYGCSSISIFHLESQGKLHPLAVTLDYRGSMENSVTIFNRRIASTSYGDEAADWPWRYAKMCSQVSDWLRHEVNVHLVNTHFVEEVIIVAVNRTFEPSHIVFNLLEPHWNTTLSLNAAARETLVPKIILEMTGFTGDQTYAFLKEAYRRFDWTGQYVPNDLRKRGFPIEDLDKPKYHNCGYARNIAEMWNILRKFVGTVLRDAYRGGDWQVANDQYILHFCHEVRSDTGGQLSSFPIIKTLDDLIDFVTMYIHVASPQHTAVNYLQQYYQTFVPNRPSALYRQIPRSLTELQRFTEADVVKSLPTNQPREWWTMAQVPYLLSFEVAEENTLLQFALMTAKLESTPQIIRDAAGDLAADLDVFSRTVMRHSLDLDDHTKTAYRILHPDTTAVSILI